MSDLISDLRKIISIHVPREGHDDAAKSRVELVAISIHVPREGHDTAYKFSKLVDTAFQSTCPARGTTIAADTGTTRHEHFNPRAPRGARHQYKWRTLQKTTISIHVPREGHDASCIKTHNIFVDFNPRAPRGARPLEGGKRRGLKDISIHVPREGHDHARAAHCCRN